MSYRLHKNFGSMRCVRCVSFSHDRRILICKLLEKQFEMQTHQFVEAQGVFLLLTSLSVSVLNASTFSLCFAYVLRIFALTPPRIRRFLIYVHSFSF